MAVSYVGSGSLAANATTTTLTVSRHATVAQNDILVAVIIQKAQQVITFPAGWTKAELNGGAGMRVSIGWKRAGASEGSTYDFTKPTDDNTLFAGAIATFSGCSTTTDPSMNAGTYTATSATINSGSLAGFVTDDWCLFVAGIGDDLTSISWDGSSNPTLTDRWGATQDTTSGTDGGVVMSSGPITSNTTVSGRTGTLNAAISNIGFLIRLPVAPTVVNLTPTPVVLDLAVPAPTILGAVALAPTPVAVDLGVLGGTAQNVTELVLTPVVLDLSLTTPTLGLSLALAPAPVLADLVVPGAAVETISDIELAPAPVALLLAVPAPTLGLGALNLAPAPVALGTAVPATQVGVGALTLSLTPVPMDLGVPAPTLGLGAVTLSPSSVVLDLSISPPTISTSLSIAVDPVLVVLGVPASLVQESGVPIELTPGVVVLGLGALGADLALQLGLSPGPVGLSLATPASQVEPGALALQPGPVTLGLQLGAFGQIGPFIIVTGSDLSLVQEMVAYWEAYDAAATEVERQGLLRYWLLTHGGKVRVEDGFRIIRGGLFPVRVTF